MHQGDALHLAHPDVCVYNDVVLQGGQAHWLEAVRPVIWADPQWTIALLNAATREERRIHRAQLATMVALLPLFARDTSPNGDEECLMPTMCDRARV